MHFVHHVGRAHYMAFAMFWEILWALILEFFISGVVQAVVSKRKIAKVLGNDRPKTIAVAFGLGATSSSCSYAAVAIARALFRKGANFTAAMAFELGSTNLVAELKHHHGYPPRLAVHPGRVLRRSADGRDHGRAVSNVSQTRTHSAGTRTS